MKKKNLLIAVFVIATAMFSGCAKDGATGPAGPQGPAGTNGTNGTNGNSNVSIATFSVTNWNDVDGNGTVFEAPLPPDTALESNSSSAVEVFFSADGNNWSALPFTYVASTDYFMSFQVSVVTNLITVLWVYNGIGGGGMNPNTVFSATSQFKVIVIPPAARMASASVNWKDYNQVKAVIEAQNNQLKKAL